MLSTTADHALRAVLYLSRFPPGTRVPADEIADATGAPRNYLAKTLHALVRSGVVSSARGPLGGFALAIPAEVLTVARVVDPFDEPRAHPRCMLGRHPCSSLTPCAVHVRWTEVLEARRGPLAKTTIARLTGDAEFALSRAGEPTGRGSASRNA